jgi:thymidylate synthase (FAD)
VQSKDNKQVRNLVASVERAKSEECAQIIADTCRLAFRRYRVLLERGVPRELARSVLPVATYSHMFASVNLLNLLRFLSLRSDAGAQYEIAVYALALRDLVREVVPTCVALGRQIHDPPWSKSPAWGPTGHPFDFGSRRRAKCSERSRRESHLT